MAVKIASKDGSIHLVFKNQKEVSDYLGVAPANISSAIKRSGSATAKNEHAGVKFLITSDDKNPKARLIKKKKSAKQSEDSSAKVQKKTSPIETALNNWKTFTGETFVDFSPEKVSVKSPFGSGVDQIITSWCKSNRKFSCKPIAITEDSAVLIEIWKEG